MHHKFGLTPFPLTSTRTKRPSTRKLPDAARDVTVTPEVVDAVRDQAPVAGSTPSPTADAPSEEGAQ